jgi:hypothetical protein
MSEKKKIQEPTPRAKTPRARPSGASTTQPTGTAGPDFSSRILEAARALEGRSFSSPEEKREALVDRVVELLGGAKEQQAELREFLLLLIETDPRLSEWE